MAILDNRRFSERLTMAHVDALIEKIGDPILRKEVKSEVDALLIKRSFGLVFQQHQPESVELPGQPVRRNATVRIVGDSSPEMWRVDKVDANGAELISFADPGIRRFEGIRNVVVVREFGQALYPGLRSIDRIESDPEKPVNCVINGENFHALETLLYAYEASVDAIYIDPPYNSGARDWKYNNDYVDSIDQYRHSKWLAFMERRLLLAKRLLNPQSSAMVVTIDEREVHHLGMLIEQVFPTAQVQMTTIVNSPLGQARRQELARVDEYAFFVFVGDASPYPGLDDLLSESGREARSATNVRWERLLRGGTNAGRADRPNMFYPVFIRPSDRSIVRVGDPLPANVDRSSVVAPAGTVAVWPMRTNGAEGRWRVSARSLEPLISNGHAKVGSYDRTNDRWTISYLGRAQLRRVQSGELEVVGREPNGAVIVEHAGTQRRSVVPKTVWNRASHRAGEYGSALLSKFIPGRSFPFPKSLYAVEDTLRILVGGKPEALVLDFFAGSGTTGHALARLNAEDGGRRRFVLVTNNEVSEEEARSLRSQGLQPGDQAWENLGIFHHVTVPRIRAAFTGHLEDGSAVTGSYLDESLFSDGFPENVEFFNLTYEDPDLVSLGRKFKAIASLLWLKAGAVGTRVEAEADGWALPPGSHYSVLFDVHQWREFVDTVKNSVHISHVFVVTDSEAVFQRIASELPTHISATQMYDDYLKTFAINTGGHQ